jgi:hypothetical protein
VCERSPGGLAYEGSWRSTLPLPTPVRPQASSTLPGGVEPLIDIGAIEVERAQQDLWKTGVLAPVWAQRFPELFREHDLRFFER